MCNCRDLIISTELGFALAFVAKPESKATGIDILVCTVLYTNLKYEAGEQGSHCNLSVLMQKKI